MYCCHFMGWFFFRPFVCAFFWLLCISRCYHSRGLCDSGNQRSLSLSLCVIVSCFFLLMEDSLACRTLGSVFMKRRYPFHGVSVRFSVKLAFLLSAPVSYFIGYIFMSIDIRISPIGMLFPSSFLQSSWLEVHWTVFLCSPDGSVSMDSTIWVLCLDETPLFFQWRPTAFASMHGGMYARRSI